MKKPHFYGWTALLGVMLVYFGLCGTLTYAYGVFLPSMIADFGWSRSALSGPYGVFSIVGGLLGPLAGITVARFGPRRNIVLCNLIVMLGLIGMSGVREIWQVHLFFGIMGGIGIAFGEFVAVTTVVNNWFVRRRAPAMGFLFASGGLGGLAFPPLIAYLIAAAGWRHAWIWLAGIHLILTVVLGGLLLRNRPEDMGQLPDGLPEPQETKDGITRTVYSRVYQTSEDWTVKEAVHSPVLWLITGLFSILIFATNILATHQIAYLQDLNFSPLASSSAFGMMIGLSIFGRLVSGTLAMRFETRKLAAVFLATMGLGVLSLLAARSTAFVYLYSILTGIGFGGMIVLFPNLFSAYFGRTHYSRIIGWTVPVSTLISAGGPSLTGYIHDLTGSYVYPFSLVACLLLLSALLVLFARPPRLNRT